VTICGVLLLIFSLQIAVNFLFAEKFYVSQKINLLKEVYEEILDLNRTSQTDIEDIISSLDIDNNIEILIADENFNWIYSNRPEFVPPMEIQHDRNFDFDIKEYMDANSGTATGPIILKTNTEDKGIIRLFSRVEHQDTSYYLLIQLPIKSISREMKSTNIFILYISSFALIAGGLIVYFIAKQFAKPIEDVNKVAISVSKLNFSTRAKVTRRKDEIGSLATNINIMADRLMENIINLQEANKKLEYDNEVMNKVDEQRKELIANISHELKTPLAILAGYTEMLSNDVAGIDKPFYYETILDEARKMDIMIQNLLNLSNMENKLTNLNLEEIDLIEFTEWIYRKNSLLMKNKGIQSEFISSPCKKVLADPLYIEEAINNYISNAIRYTDTGNLLKVKVEQVEDDIILSVYNEGINIDELHMDKIWNSFYREDKSRRRTSQNNIGLGLYIVRSILNAHHGKCGVTNKDKGVEFWLSLKVKQEPTK